MKRLLFLIIGCLFSFSFSMMAQTTNSSKGLSLATYKLPKFRAEFAPTNFQYYQPATTQQSDLPKLMVNQKDLKKAKRFSIFANALYLLSSANTPNNFGSIGLTSPAFDPLISPANNANDYLRLQQHQFQRIGTNPLLLAAPKALQLRF